MSKELSDRFVALAVTGGFLVVSLAGWFYFGPRLGGDSERFLSGASNLATGGSFEGKQGNYFGYSMILVPLREWLGLGFGWIVWGQILSCAVGVYFWTCQSSVVFGKAASILGGGLVVLYPGVWKWNLYVMTDGPFITTSLFAVGGFLAWRTDHRLRWILISMVASLVGASLRPNGWVLLGVLWVFLLIFFLRYKWAQKVSVAILLLAGLLLGMGMRNVATGSLVEDPVYFLKQGIVVWGWQDWSFKMPTADSSDGDGWGEYIRYFLEHPMEVIGLWSARVGVSLVPLRPGFSIPNQLLTVVYLVPIYLFFVLGLRRIRSEYFWVLTYLVLAFFPAALFFANWDGRWLDYLFPFLGPAVGVGALILLERIGFGSQILKSSRTDDERLQICGGRGESRNEDLE
ncbi:MAG: hypothetical protein AAGJ81_11790 [Verrucomicrobiota bacterium]